MNLRLIPAAVRLGDPTGCWDFAAIRHAYVRMAAEGCAAFTQVPTIMPIIDGGGGTALNLARAMLKPTNCCPSLHTAAPFFAYNAAASHFPEKREQLRQCVADVVSTVIKAKFHAVIDVSFGILLAKKVVEDDLRLDFDDLEIYFTQFQKDKDHVPYERVYQTYRDICGLSKTMGNEGSDVAGLMRRYFREMGLPMVKRRRSNCFYDLKRQTLVYHEQLKVGKGLL